METVNETACEITAGSDDDDDDDSA